ncbi:hypothetical protein NNO_1607 [Hydrogenimonas sp.]|nr:hypothetical protein NNO_1607 [Hydrogenimonas sp.]
MYSESDFENFSKKITASALNRAEKIVEEAKARAEEKVHEAEKEAAEILAESEEILGKELRSFEEERRAKIESETERERQHFLSGLKSGVLEGVERELEERFGESAEIFLEWLKKRFGEGELQIYEKLDTEGLDSFKVVKTGRKSIVFSKDNLIMEFDPRSLMEEYGELIDEELAKRIGV